MTSFEPFRSLVTAPFGAAPGPSADPLLARLQQVTRGDYDVSGELGRGGMAVVYVGTDRQLQRRVAIKVMDPRLGMTPGMSERFLQEARIAARLQHPNIIVVHDVRQSDDLTYFVMSLIDGIAVDELCRAVNPIPIDQIRWILLQATRSLAYANSEGIVHRDIKPANILLNLKGDVILTDFGIAKALGDTGLTQSGMQVGTPMYMSPEQFTGEAVGSASDQYALGITAYQLLVGHAPFTGDLYQLISAHGSKAPVPVRDLRPDCPAFLANAVMRMLEKRPADRWPSLEDLQDVFGANMAMDGGTARRKLSETVRSLRGEGSSGASSGSLATPISGTQSAEAVVVTISPPGATIFVSGSLELRASVTFDTGTSVPGAAVQWRSSDESVLRVESNGTVVGVAPGSVVVQAAVNGAWSEATIRVEAAPIARLSLTSPSVTMRVGDVLRPDVVAVDVNGAVCEGVAMSWISRSPAVADLDAPGVVRAIAQGMAVIDVSAGNVRRSLDVAVIRRPITRLHVQASARSLELGDTLPLTVEAFDDVGTSVDVAPVRWTSSAPSVIHIDSTGRALAIGSGTARISASVDEAVDFVELESIEPEIGSVQLLLTEERVEIGDAVPWSLRVKDVQGASRSTAGVRIWSSDPAIVHVEENGARAWAVGVGEALLHAAPETGETAIEPVTSVRVVVTPVVVARLEAFPAALDLEAGAVSALNVQGVDRRGIPLPELKVQWTVDGPDVALLEGGGIVRALAPGACTLRATASNADGSTVDIVIPVRVRRASVARLQISAERIMLEVGDTTTLQVTTFDAMDLEVADAVPTWRSAQPAVARVERNGEVVALSAGRTTITAELDGKQGQLALIVAAPVVDHLALTAPADDVVVGRAVRLTVSALGRNAQPVTPTLRWQVEPSDAASISADGEMTALRAGPFTVRATTVVPSDATEILSRRGPIDASVMLEARAPHVHGARFDRATLDVAIGRSARADLRVSLEVDTPSAHASVPAVTWTSSASDVATVDDAGLVHAVSEGTTRVQARVAGHEATLEVRVVPVVVVARSNRAAMIGAAAIVLAGIAWFAWPSGAPDPADAEPPVAVEVPPSPTSDPVVAERAPDTVDQPSADSQPVSLAATAPTTAPTTPTVTPREPARRVSPPTTASADASRARAQSAAVPPRAEPPADTTTQRATTEVTPPPGATPPTRTPPAAAPPSAAELRAVADRVVRDLRGGAGSPSDALREFLGDGAEHSLSASGAPSVTSTEGGLVQAQFTLALSRYNSGGIRERRVSVVQMRVERRGNDVVLLSTVFGPLTRP